MLPQEIIRKKKDGLPLSDSEIQYYIEGISNGSVSESHIAAFCMAVMFKGMSTEETFFSHRPYGEIGRQIKMG